MRALSLVSKKVVAGVVSLVESKQKSRAGKSARRRNQSKRDLKLVLERLEAIETVSDSFSPAALGVGVLGTTGGNSLGGPALATLNDSLDALAFLSPVGGDRSYQVRIIPVGVPALAGPALDPRLEQLRDETSSTSYLAPPRFARLSA